MGGKAKGTKEEANQRDKTGSQKGAVYHTLDARSIPDIFLRVPGGPLLLLPLRRKCMHMHVYMHISLSHTHSSAIL